MTEFDKGTGKRSVVKRLVICIRVLLTGAIVFLVYKETGPWTAASICLISITLELQGSLNKKILDICKLLSR